ncbi:hypothetical protein [Hymenobacter cellulosivorans]|uniref:Uncharacterized protein n=1 Tax=Hymenobacter cellulosivorans TaxID=2932249 RepID=A0ABY4FBA6_9BACT|nr:hypothetical protein [Hymenobacter cellulosivorans]UOQ53705.1 hypothetical protein MUN80_02850 [Hymenobacter cellulosivorans]
MPPFISQLQELRQQLPIGIRHALQLLERTQGNVAAAAQLFKQELTELVMSKTGVARPVAEQHLAAAKYEVPRALYSIRAELYTLTEHILIRYQADKSEALSRIQSVIQRETPLVRKEWLEVSELPKLNRPQACVILLCEWLGFEDWEDLTSALYFHLDLVTTYLRQELQQDTLAVTLLAMRDRHAALQAKYATASFEVALKRIQNDKLLQGYEAEYEHLKPRLLDRLYSYVQEHIGSFP